MSHNALHPPFGAADLTNCERELIHLAGSIQPQGVLIVLREPDLSVTQASLNAVDVLGVEHAALLGLKISALGGDLADHVSRLIKGNLLTMPTPICCRIKSTGESRALEGMLHRQPRSGVILELQVASREDNDKLKNLPHTLAESVERITAAMELQELGNEVVRCVRELTGYDRVMVYQFDADGHGEVVAEARKDSLEPFLGQHYPASDVPQRARELYMRNRVRVLVDVHYTPVPIVPRHSAQTGEDLDMSLCGLRSMSPLHLQYLQNMGVTATLVTSLVRDGRLWGLIACHHYSAKTVASETRAACELLSEIVSTRISALENRAQIRAELFVRDLEQRLVRSATETGDWRGALFDDPTEKILTPLDAMGAVLFYQGEILTAGSTPSETELRAFNAWLVKNVREGLLQTSSLQKLDADVTAMAAQATGVLAIELSKRDGEYLVWFRPEQLRTVTWAGNPEKPVDVGSDPRDLSPRRSFAAWSELVRDTAKQWSPTDIAMATAIRGSLVDMILQMRALRALIAEKHATSTLSVIEAAGEPMILADGDGKVLIVNDAFHRLVERPLHHIRALEDLLALSLDQSRMREILQRVNIARQPWRGELRLTHGASGEIPVAVRADPVPGLRGDVLGYILIFTDLRQQREARAARARLERAIAESHVEAPLGPVAAMLTQDFDQLLSAILANASAAIMQITDSSAEASTGSLLRELEGATRRAAELTAQILGTVSRNRQQI
ncbi:MAG: GAF domain-containing protein [Gemmatimonadaceae bacterium]